MGTVFGEMDMERVDFPPGSGPTDLSRIGYPFVRL